MNSWRFPVFPKFDEFIRNYLAFQVAATILALSSFLKSIFQPGLNSKT